jgi:CHRD domain
MNTFNGIQKVLGASLGAAAIVLAGCAMMSLNRNVSVSLTGAEQVPPVSTAASGTGSFTVTEDRSVSGSVTVSGLAPVAAHIHTGKRGANGPVAVGMNKTSDNVWAIPAGAKFTEDQYKAFLAGDTYVNVHTAANKGGEIRAQLQP